MDVVSPHKETVRLRLALIVGALLICGFMWADIVLLPDNLHDTYFFNRLYFQVPTIVLVVGLSYAPFFYAKRHWIFTLLMVVLTLSNFGLIHQSWIEANFAFPYEGTILYAFYCVFALGIPFKLALLAALINVIGFVLLMVVSPVYGERVMISSAFVAGSLFICVYAKYRLDRVMELSNVINDVLDLSKIESGMSEIDLIEFNLDSMLSDLVTLLGTNASANNTRLEYKSRNLDSVMVTSDLTKLRQIIINLISNAIKFTQQGTVSISAKLKQVAQEEAQDNKLVISVKDTGIGIEPDRLESIFEKFTQSDSSISRRYGGTGLGLAIARELAQLLGGDIKVSSKVGEGSCFTVTANVRARSVDLVGTNVDKEACAATPAVNHNLNVLLAEDNAINAVVAQALLEQLGCNVIHVDNGLKASTRVLEGDIDVVFMDIHMPVMDGVEATKRIRKLDSGAASTPIIGLTAEAFKERHDTFIEAGMNNVVTKPVTIEALKESLVKLERENTLTSSM